METPEVLALREIVALLQWALTIAGTLAIGMVGVWWRVETRQDQKMEAGFMDNDSAHDKLYKKIERTNEKLDEVREDLTDQHLVIRDKIEDVWKHMSLEGGKHGSRKSKTQTRN